MQNRPPALRHGRSRGRSLGGSRQPGRDQTASGNAAGWRSTHPPSIGSSSIRCTPSSCPWASPSVAATLLPRQWHFGGRGRCSLVQVLPLKAAGSCEHGPQRGFYQEEAEEMVSHIRFSHVPPAAPAPICTRPCSSRGVRFTPARWEIRGQRGAFMIHRTPRTVPGSQATCH